MFTLVVFSDEISPRMLDMPSLTKRTVEALELLVPIWKSVDETMYALS